MIQKFERFEFSNAAGIKFSNPLNHNLFVTFRKARIKYKKDDLFLSRKNKKELSDSELVVLAKKRQDYFGELYNRYFDQIFRFTFKRLGGLEDIAGDLTQQTFLKAMANLSKYEDRGLPFCSWLYRIAQNEISMYFRSQKVVRKISIDERSFLSLCEEVEIGNYMSVEDQEKLIELMNDMEQEQLDLIELRFFQGLSFKEIADIYTITEPNAKMRVYRILEKLQKKWADNK